MRACTGSPAEPALDRPGSEPVPGYRLLERVGVGGAGEVWSAEAPGGLRVALKIVRLAGGLGQREMANLRILRAIRHPNLLAYFGAWQAAGRLIIGMELADRSLWDRCVEATGQGLVGIPLSELLEALGEAAKVIDFLNEPRHQLDGQPGVAIRHRDIKPQNIMLIGQGVKVADFGLSCLGDQTGLTRNTTGLTFAYAAPETFRRRTSAASDQYSLAVTYCQLRTGRLPFVGSPTAVMLGHLSGAPDLARLPEPERPIVGRALAKEPGGRWPNCRAFIQALARCADQGSPETIATAWAELLGDSPDSGSILIPPLPEPCAESAAISAESVSVDGASGPDRGSALLPKPPAPAAGEPSGPPTVVVAATAMVRAPGRTPRALLVAALVLAAGAALCSWKFAGRAAVPSPRTDPVIDRGAGERILPGPAPRDLAPASSVMRTSLKPTSSPAREKTGATAPPPPPPVPTRPSKPRQPRLAGLQSLFSWKSGNGWDGPRGSLRRLSTWEILRAVARLDAPAATTVAPPGGAKQPAPARSSSRAEAPAAVPAGDLRLTLPETLRVEAGRSRSVPVRVSRGAFTGPLTVHFEGLPAGVSMPDLTIPAGQCQVEARVVARPDATTTAASVGVIVWAGSARGEGKVRIRLEVRPNPAKELRARGYALLACGRPEEAVAALTRALEAGAPDPIAYHNRGLAYALLNRLDLALADYDAASRLRPDDPAIRYNRGVAWARRGDDARALDDFDTALRLDPGYVRAYEARARIHLKRGDLARFQADRDRAAQLTRTCARPPAPEPPPPHPATSPKPSAPIPPGPPTPVPTRSRLAATAWGVPTR